MDFATLSYWARGVVAVALLGAAMWKLRHRAVFRRSLGRAVPRISNPPDILVVAIPVLEIVVAALMLTPGRLGQLGSGAALGLLVLFTVVVVSLDATTPCGCWRDVAGQLSPHSQRRALLLRNAVLIAAATVGLSHGVSFSFGAMSVGLVTGGLIGLLAMEIPQIVAVATFVQSAGKASES